MSEDIDIRLSIRSWKEFFDLSRKGIDKEIAAYLIFGSRGEELLEAILLSDDNTFNDLEKIQNEEE